MKINKGTKIYILLALIISVLSISIAYAVLSTSLNISGSAEVQGSTWNIFLGKGISINGDDYETTGTGVYNDAVFNGPSATYSISLSKPGDSVTYYFRIYNEGTLNAEVDSIVNATPTCTSSTNNTQDASLVCDNLTYEVSYSDGLQIQSGDVVNTAKSPNDPDTCLKGTTLGNIRSIKVKITFKENVTSVPSSTVSINNLKTTINMKQTDKECENNGSSSEPV